MSTTINIKKGLDIPLPGAAGGETVKDTTTRLFAVCPDDFPGYTWKIAVKVGDKLAIGDPLLRAKEDPEICLTSMVNGNVKEINRGARRKIEYVSVEASDSESVAAFSSAGSVLSDMKKSGLYAMMRQRPFDIVPMAHVKPRDIFVTSFDSAPLAPAILSKEDTPYLESGLKALASLTDGKVYLGVREGSGINSQVAEVIEIGGPHPTGNVGVQIAAVKPVNKGEVVWTLDVRTAARIGRMVKDSKLSFRTVVAITGPDAENPHLVDTLDGAALGSLLKGQIKKTEGKVRVISGNVLTGIKVETESGFLRYPYRQITLIDEGDQADEFMGWASMNPKKYSVKKTFPAFLRGLTKPFNFDARIKGGHRAMILSGEYDKVFPMDIYPEYLIKAILAKDIEKMEQLGIYEVAPEDFALPEFVDTSKLELQKIVRDGLDYLRKETL